MSRGMASDKKIEMEERRAIAYDLRKQGGSFDEIAETMREVPKSDVDPDPRWPKYSNAQAHRDVMAVLKRLKKQNEQRAELVKTMELERMDALWLVYYGKALKGDYAALDRCLSLMDKRARYEGFDKPKLIDLTSGGLPLSNPIEAALTKVWGEPGDEGKSEA